RCTPMRGMGLGTIEFPKAAAALLVGAVATASSLYLLAYSGQERFEPLEVAASVASSVIKPGTPVEATPTFAEDSAEPAPEPIVERVALEQPASVQEFLQGAGMGTTEAEQWAKA